MIIKARKTKRKNKQEEIWEKEIKEKVINQRLKKRKTEEQRLKVIKIGE